MTTQHLNREVEAAVAEKATPIRKGYWRNEFTCSRRFKMRGGSTYDPGTHLSDAMWPTKEIAEQKWFEAVISDPDVIEAVGLVYHGARFFPANTDNQGDGA